MTILRRNKKGRYSDRLSRSKENWERGRGAKKKGNPSYTPSGSPKRYRVRNRSSMSGFSLKSKVVGYRKALRKAIKR